MSVDTLQNENTKISVQNKVTRAINRHWNARERSLAWLNCLSRQARERSVVPQSHAIHRGHQG